MQQFKFIGKKGRIYMKNILVILSIFIGVEAHGQVTAQDLMAVGIPAAAAVKLTEVTTVATTGITFPVANYEAVAGAGTTIANATAMSVTKHVHRLTGANGTVGWKFGTSVAGQFEVLLNTTAGVPLIYAASGGTCNGGSADAACTLVTGIVAHLCYSTAVNTWICS